MPEFHTNGALSVSILVASRTNRDAEIAAKSFANSNERQSVPGFELTLGEGKDWEVTVWAPSLSLVF
jgi:hypothetical protein